MSPGKKKKVDVSIVISWVEEVDNQREADLFAAQLERMFGSEELRTIGASYISTKVANGADVGIDWVSLVYGEDDE